jgi:thiamine pyrophosphate-dependent acetolactate synthase large subunit-like protein
MRKARRWQHPVRPSLQAVCAGTTGPGSNHLVAGLYKASRDHAPWLALSGEMPRKLQGIDYIQATEPDLLFRDVARYTETMSSAAQAAGVFHQAGHLQARSSGTWPRGDPPFHFMEISHADDT